MTNETTAERRLPSWAESGNRNAILDFIDAADSLPIEQRVAVFDNDGTLWCEKPNYPQLDFMLGELQRAVGDDPELAARAEYRALLEHDDAAQAEIGLERIAMALVQLCAGIEPAVFDARVRSFFDRSVHADRGVPLLQLRYQPMLELIDELRANNFGIFIVTGGGTEFVRAISRPFYGVSPEGVVGSLVGYELIRNERNEPVLLRTDEPAGTVNEGPAKIANIQRSLGRRPILAAGNSPGDTEMLEYAMASDGPSLALLIDHDDADREYAYEGSAASFSSEGSLTDIGRDLGWTVVSMRNDWTTVFAPIP